MAAKWLKATLFGRQLSHGSDKESPQTFDEALQQPCPFDFEPEQVQGYGNEPNEEPFLNEPNQMPFLNEPNQMPYYGGEEQQQMPTLTPSNIGGVGASPGASAMKAAYNVSIYQ